MIKKKKVFVGVMGLIGAGKTTLADELSKVLKCEVYHEIVVDNKYLEAFYNDMKKNSFLFQINLLNQRFEQQQYIIWNDNNEFVIQDRTIYEDPIFATTLYEDGMLTELEYETYNRTYENVTKIMKNNDVIIYLDVSPEKSFERIKKRNRNCEKGITLEYLKHLHKNYEKFVDSISKSINIIKISWENFVSTEIVAEKIKNTYENIKNIHKINFNS